MPPGGIPDGSIAQDTAREDRRLRRLFTAWAREPYRGSTTQGDFCKVAIGSMTRQRYILPLAYPGTPTPFYCYGNGTADTSKRDTNILCT